MMADGGDKRTRLGTGAESTESGSHEIVTPAGTPAPVSPILNYTPPVDALIGRTLVDRYYIEKKLGEGGMGSVYLARHVTLDKEVALKVLHGEYARKEDLVERFLQEARAASKIRHENVIDITDFGTTEDGQVFFAMELLIGHDLHEEISRARLESRSLPWKRIQNIFLQICSALSAAHKLGIIHRDLKPENIYLVKWLGHDDFVKLLDFGIAKMTAVGDGARKLTRTGMLFGTPEYMSPEQARGDKPDARVDVYAMGCIMFQLVTGRVPFEAENFMGVLSLHLTEPPPKLGDARIAVGGPDGLEEVVAKALEKDRDQRYLSIDDLAAAVRGLDGGRPMTEPAPDPVDEKVARRKSDWTGSAKLVSLAPDDKRVARSPGKTKLWIGLGAVAIAAVAGIAIAISQGGDKASSPELAEPAVVVPPTEPASVPDEPTQLAPSDNAIEISTVPPKSKIYRFDTKAFIGEAPVTIKWPIDAPDFKIEIVADDYPRQTFEIKNETGKFLLELVRGHAATKPLQPTVKPVKPDKPKPDKPKPKPKPKPDDGTGDPKIKTAADIFGDDK